MVFPSTTLSIVSMIRKTSGPADYNVVCLAVNPPSLTNSSHAQFNFMSIYVPDGSVSSYKAASKWSDMASKIKPLSEYTG